MVWWFSPYEKGLEGIAVASFVVLPCMKKVSDDILAMMLPYMKKVSAKNLTLASGIQTSESEFLNDFMFKKNFAASTKARCKDFVQLQGFPPPGYGPGAQPYLYFFRATSLFIRLQQTRHGIVCIAYGL